MSSPTNVTDRISHLRERRAHSKIMTGNRSGHMAPRPCRKPDRERRFATDVFMLFAYSLLGLALFSQFILMVWLEMT